MLMVAALVCGGAGLAARAQVAAEPPIHLAHVEGFVVDPEGKPLVNAEITLERDNIVAYKTTTDDAGEFEFEHITGDYSFRVARTKYAPALREIHVGELIQSYMQRRKLYVIVGPGACTDSCSSIYTSKHDFQRAIQKRNKK